MSFTPEQILNFLRQIQISKFDLDDVFFFKKANTDLHT